MAEQLGLINGMELQNTDEVPTKTLFFADGVSRIDYVLAYCEEEDEEELDKQSKRRELFIHNIKQLGLDIEESVSTKNGPKDDYGATQQSQEEKEDITHFVKIHAPFDLLCDMAEDLMMKMPIANNDIEIKSFVKRNFPSLYKWMKKMDPFVIMNKTVKQEPNFFVATFDKARLKEYIGSSNEIEFFSPAERSRLVYNLLETIKYGSEDLDIGIDSLVHHGGFLAQYPLHDGSVDDHGETPENDRQRLHADWARMGRIFNYQPIHGIKEYFGEKVALYFAWLGFYTAMLLPAAIVGFICFLYGVGSAFNYTPVEEICHPKNASLFYMCPLCDELCSYYLLSTTTCLYAKVTHFFDNQATLFFALFMSFWAVFFLEFWKRKQASLAYEWHTMDFEEEEQRPRPEYRARVTRLRPNPVSGKMEPYMPATQRVPRLVSATGIVIFFIILVIAGVTSVIVYRAAIYAILLSVKSNQIKTRAKIVVAGTAACINLLVINLLKIVYKKVAVMLTDWENPRTQTDYEDSFTVKMFWFQFVNTYASVFYVAFFKSEYFVGSPGKYKRFGGATAFRFEGCSAQGCFLELCVQLIIIMVGQQFIGNVTEIGIPWVMKKIKRRNEDKYHITKPQWERDYDLQPQDDLSLFWQYLEIVLQYGFVTMFVAAFPLAPFFAWLNNIFEIRLDAINFISNFRRPVAQRAQDIGAWFGILTTLTDLSVIVNAFVLAFTSELIPKLVYVYGPSPDGTLAGYVDHSLSYFNVADFAASSRPANPNAQVKFNMTTCRYPGYHEPNYPYNYSKDYWVILTARLAFIFVFQWFITVVTRTIAYVIPDMPKSLQLKIKRENFLAKEKEKTHKEKCGKRKARSNTDAQGNKASEDLTQTATQML